MTGETFGLKAYFGPRGDNLYVLPAALPRWHSHPTLTKPNCSEIGIECFADLLAEGMWAGLALEQSMRAGIKVTGAQTEEKPRPCHRGSERESGRSFRPQSRLQALDEGSSQRRSPLITSVKRSTSPGHR